MMNREPLVIRKEAVALIESIGHPLSTAWLSSRSPADARPLLCGFSKLFRHALILSGCLSLVVLGATAHAQSSATLAWDPSAGTGIAGYRIYQGGASASYTNTVPVGNFTRATIPGLRAGATYYFAATAYDADGLESDFSNEISYTVPAATNGLPTIALTSPANGANYTGPATISLAASVTANGHTISQVQFYNGATLLRAVTVAPYSFSWTNVSTGSYSLSARTVYDSGSTVASAVANVTVSARKRPHLHIRSSTTTTAALAAPVAPSVVLNATDGDPGAVFSLQSSPDLRTWSAIATMTLDATGCCQVTNSASPGSTKNFYRLQAP
jgi:hypothetical protein